MVRLRALLCALVLVVAYSGITSAQTQQAPAFDLNAAPSAAAAEGVGQFRPRPVPNTLPRLGVGVKVGTLGIGFQVGTALTDRVNVRGGANFFNYNDSLTEHGVVYNGTLQLRSVEAKLDFAVNAGLVFSHVALALGDRKRNLPKKRRSSISLRQPLNTDNRRHDWSLAPETAIKNTSHTRESSHPTGPAVSSQRKSGHATARPLITSLNLIGISFS